MGATQPVSQQDLTAPLPGRTSSGAAASTSGAPAYNVSPLHVLLVGAGALGAGALVTAALSYKQAEKTLRAEGIDPRMRQHVLPHALKALTASLALTGCVGVAGFYGLKAAGLVSSERVGLPSMADTWQMMLHGPGGARVRAAQAAAHQQGPQDTGSISSLQEQLPQR